MLRSLNETLGELRKAALGAGYSAGLAEDISRAAGELILLGLDGTKAFLHAMHSGPADTTFRISGTTSFSPAVQENVRLCQRLEIFDLDVASHGMSVFEMITTEPAGTTCHLSKVDPLILWLAMGIAVAKTYQCKFEISIEGQGIFSVSPSRSFSALQLERLAKLPECADADLVLVNEPGDEASSGGAVAAQTDAGGVRVNEALWPQISALAAKTYVPSSSISRNKGAGAIVDDNE